MESTTVCLVNMPYTPIERPSIALGLLQARLQRDGLRARTVYADLLFADRIGAHLHNLITAIRPQDALGDWTFAHILFPDWAPDTQAFIDRLAQRNRVLHGCDAPEFHRMMLDIRTRASRFVDELVELILSMRPRVVGCSSTYGQQVSSLALLKRIREAAPRVSTIMGGANCETSMGRSIHRQFPWLDYVVSGEADHIISPLVRAILEDGQGAGAAGPIENVWTPAHRNAGYPRNAAEEEGRGTLLDLDDQCAPNYDDYFATLEGCRIRDHIQVALPVETSRGCWWGSTKGCAYCSLNGCRKTFRSKPAGRVLEELDELHRRYGVHRFLASDNSLEMAYFKTLFPALAAKGKPYPIYYQIMANLDRSQVRILRDAGLAWLWCGIESLHDKILSLMNKGCRSWQNIQFLKWCMEYGIYVGWYIMCDFPGEHDEWYAEMSELLPLLTHLQPPWAFARVRIDRYSDYHRRPDHYGLELQPAELYSHIYPFSQDVLKELVYYFEDRERFRDPLFTALLTRPGIRAASRAGARWKIAFWSDERARLTMSIGESTLHIQDTRPVAAASSFTLQGLDMAVYLACDEAIRRERLFEVLEEQGNPKERILAAVEGLKDRKLMVELQDRLLALAVREPMADLPPRDAYPGGAVLLRARQDMEKTG